MAIGGYASSSWQFSRLNNTNTRTSVFDTVNSNTSAKLGTTDEVDEEETIDVSNLSAKEIQLLELQELEEFKSEIYAEIENILKNQTSKILSHSIHITDEAFQRMKDDSEFKDKFLDKLQYHSCNSSHYYCDVHCTTYITENDDDWSFMSYNVPPDCDEETEEAKQKDADDRAVGSFYSSGCNSSCEAEPSDGLDFDEIWLEQKEQLEYQETIRQQRELISKGGEN